ncbi:MAG TPA: YggT family protein [Actinobacteria bacterium]|nr:YggT family protein [Actinomycetota bacterium]
MVVIRLVDTAFVVYFWLIIIRVIFSWIPLSSNAVVERVRGFVYELTDPYLNLFRRLLPILNLGGMGLDLSPIIAILALGFIHRIAVSILLQVLVRI